MPEGLALRVEGLGDRVSVVEILLQNGCVESGRMRVRSLTACFRRTFEVSLLLGGQVLTVCCTSLQNPTTAGPGHCKQQVCLGLGEERLKYLNPLK